VSAGIRTIETFGDRARAFVLALVVHLLCIGVLFLGLWLVPPEKPVALTGPIIEAELVGAAAAPRPPRATSRPKPAPPKPEPPKPPEPKPETPSEPQRTDTIEREKIADMAQQQAEQALRAQEEKHRQEQVELREEQKREAVERERMKQLEDIKRQREAAEKRRKLEQEKLAQLRDLDKPVKNAKPVPEDVAPAEQARTGQAGQDTGLEAEYFAAIQNAVTQNWLRPDSTPPGLRCSLHIVQIPGGEVLSVEIRNPCNADAQTRASVEQAVKRAAPLPYKGYEKVFRRDFNFNFTYDG
jgi:colicin import membrane protein